MSILEQCCIKLEDFEIMASGMDFFFSDIYTEKIKENYIKNKSLMDKYRE